MELTKESDRLVELRRYAILDTPPDHAFDQVTKLAAKLFNVPVAIVSLVDSDRIWFKSAYGVNIQQINRDAGLCASAIVSDDIYLVEDAKVDPRTLANPLVAGEFGLRFYAAAPIKVRSGHNLGVLCIIDRHPRTLTSDERFLLHGLAEIVIDQLELRLEARMASSRQNQILSMLAHELKNPLTLIPTYAQLIQEKHPEDTHVTQMCNHIQKAGNRMNFLINETLEMAQLQVNEIHLKKTEFDISTVVSRVTSMNAVLANTKQQKLYLDISDNILVFADEMKVFEIVNNLLNNAIKYSPLNTEIYVRLKREREKAIVQVVDQGPGLTDQDKEKLFLPFTRLTARPTAGENSTGLGLSIVKSLVEAHHGEVFATNNADKGTTFTVELPAIDTQNNVLQMKIRKT